MVSIKAKAGSIGLGSIKEKAIRSAVKRGLQQWGYLIVSEAQKSIQTGPKTGRVYVRGGLSHQASAPGEPPASDTGRLAASGRYELIGNGNVLQIVFGTDYAFYLEYGTSTMAARPFIRKAVKKTRKKGKAIILEEVRKAMSNGSK